MSNQTRPKPTYMVVCDLCDEEIEPQAEGAPVSRGNLMRRISPAPGTVTNETRHALLSWGRSRVPTRRPDLDQGVSYDFHGACIADLVATAVATRKRATS